MTHIAIFVSDNNNRYEFRVDGTTIYIYANCYDIAIQRLDTMYEHDIEIKD